MLRKINLTILAVILVACSSSPKSELAYIFNIAKAKEVIMIPDSLGLSSSASKGDFTPSGKHIYYSDFQVKAIFHIDRKTQKVKRFGSTGNGPAEYMMPWHIELSDTSIAYSDIMSALVKVVSLKNETEQITQLKAKGGSSFVLRGKELFYLGSSLNRYYLNGTNGDKYVPVESFYAGQKMLLNTASFIEDDVVYFTNFYEPKLFSVDLNTRTFSSKEIKNWPNENYIQSTKMSKTFSKKLFEDASKKMHGILKIHPVTKDGRGYFVITTTFEKKSYLHFVSRETYTLEKSVLLGGIRPIAFNKNEIAFYEYSTETDSRLLIFNAEDLF